MGKTSNIKQVMVRGQQGKTNLSLARFAPVQAFAQARRELGGESNLRTDLLRTSEDQSETLPLREI